MGRAADAERSAGQVWADGPSRFRAMGRAQGGAGDLHRASDKCAGRGQK